MTPTAFTRNRRLPIAASALGRVLAQCAARGPRPDEDGSGLRGRSPADDDNPGNIFAVGGINVPDNSAEQHAVARREAARRIEVMRNRWKAVGAAPLGAYFGPRD